MSLALAIIFIGRMLTIAPPLLIRVVATTIGYILVRRSRRIEQDLLQSCAEYRSDPAYDRQPSRSDRRLMRAHLQLAIWQTELASLLPSTTERARFLADR